MTLSYSSLADESMQITPANKKSSGCNLSVHGFKSRESFFNFFSKFKADLAKKDKVSISKMILYPLSTKIDNKKVQVTSKKEFIEKFDLIFTKKVIRAVSKHQVKDFFCNYQGAMIGDGEVWIKQRKASIGIATVLN
jgi:hypothetical protein